MKWALMKCIFRVGYRPETAGQGVGGIHHDCTLLGREKFNHKVCEFYPGHRILEDRFEALLLHALRTICEEKTGVIYGVDVTLLDAVNRYFSAEGPLSNCSYDTLAAYADTAYERYLTLAAWEHAHDAAFWDEPTYGPHVPSPNPGSGHAGDHTLLNNIASLRLTFWYMEFCAATAEGDIGRVMEVIKLLRLSFWGAGARNYGNELLELACNFKYEYTPELQEAILNNYLVNTSGLPGHWYELDLLQEHNNFWLKRFFNLKSLSFDSSFLRNVVSLNLRGFCDLRETMLDFFGCRRPGRRHTDADTQADLNRLGTHYKEDDVLRLHSGRTQPFVIINEFHQGLEKLRAGILQAFLQRTTAPLKRPVPWDVHCDSDDATEQEEGLPPSDEEIILDPDEEELDFDYVEPPNPIIAHSAGYTTLDPFVSLSNTVDL